MNRLLMWLLIVAVVTVGWPLISAQSAEGARIRVYAGYPYQPYVVRYRAPYYRPYLPVAPPVLPFPVYGRPIPVYPQYVCPPVPFVPAPPPHYEVW